MLWLALGYLLHVGGPMFAKVSGAVFGAAAVAAVGFVRGRPLRLYDALAPWLLALDTTYTFWAGSGLEAGAFALALALAMLLVARGSRWSALPAGLLCVLRPEGPLYVAGLLLVLFTQTASDEPQAASREPQAGAERPNPPTAAAGVGGLISRGSDIARWLALAALPALAWLAFRRLYYAAWLPNAFYAKQRWDYGGFWYLNAWFLDSLWHWALYLAPLALIAKSTRRAALIALPGCAAAVAFILYSRGDWMSEHRFAAHALPAAALAAGLVPPALADLFGHRDRDAGWLAACALVVLAAVSAWRRSPDRRRNPELPLGYIADQGRWFRKTADRLGLTHPRVAHFDIGGLALESGSEVIDLAGLADLYIGRVGYQSHAAVRDYVFDDIKPEMLNIHGPCQYLHDDPRLKRDYLLAASGSWGENWVRKSLELDGLDDRCPSGTPPKNLPQALEKATAAQAKDLWLCARAHAKALPDVRALAKKLAAQGFYDAAVTLDPSQPQWAQQALAKRPARSRR